MSFNEVGSEFPLIQKFPSSKVKFIGDHDRLTSSANVKEGLFTLPYNLLGLEPLVEG